MKKLAFLFASVTIAYACSCSGFSIKEKAFCKVHFVSHAKVVYKSTQFNHGSPRFIYVVEHLEVFKTREGLSELPTQFSSYSLSELCGIELDLGQEYLLSGLISEDGKSGHLIHCPAISGLLKKWDQVSEEEKYALLTYTCE